MALLLSQDFQSLASIDDAGGLYSNANIWVEGGGRNGTNAVQILPGANWLTYPTAGHEGTPYLNIRKGTIELWFKPMFDPSFVPTNHNGQYMWDFKWNTQSVVMPLWKSETVGQKLFPQFYTGPSFVSTEPFQFESCRPGTFHLVRFFWDLSLPNTAGFSLYYTGAGTAYCSVSLLNGIKLTATGMQDRRIFLSSTCQNLGDIVALINTISGFHATLLGDPTARGLMNNVANAVLPTTLANATVFQQMNSYILLQVNDYYAPLLWFNPLDTETMSPTARMALGTRNDHFYPGNMVFDNLKVYDSVELPATSYGPFPQNFFDSPTPENIAVYDSLFAGDGFPGAHETHATQPDDCPILDAGIAPGEDVIAFQRANFEWVLPNYVPAESEIKTTFAYKAPLGEYETVFFNIYSRIALTDMALNYTALTGPGTIVKSNLDLRVVYNWFQGTNTTSTVSSPLPFYVPELMLHSDIWDGVDQINPQLDTSLGQFKIAKLTKQDHVDTEMAAYTSKQFGLILEVPSHTIPGDYIGTVTITATEIATPIVLTLIFTILPFALRDSGSIAMPWLNIDDVHYYAGATHMNLDAWAIYQQILAEQVKHGLTGVMHGCYNDYDNGHDGDLTRGNAYVYGDGFGNPMPFLDYVEKKIQCGHNAGVKMACLYAGGKETRGVWYETLNREYTTQLVGLLTKAPYNYKPWLLGRDEFPDSPSAGYDFAVIMNARIKEVDALSFVNSVYWKTNDLNNNGYTTTNLLPGTVYTPSQTKIDGASYIISDGHLWDMIAKRAPKIPGRYETYYFQTRTPYPNYERYLCGYFRYLTKCDGPQPTWFLAGWGNDFGLFTNYGVAYPAVDQSNNFHVIPTLHGCAMREGFKDDKYLSTWQYYRDRAAISHPTQVAASDEAIKGASGILARYTDLYPYSADASWRNSPAQFAADREAIIAEIITLQNLHSTRSLVCGAIPGKVGGKKANKVAMVQQ
jgi:hypothetical protein